MQSTNAIKGNSTKCGTLNSHDWYRASGEFTFNLKPVESNITFHFGEHNEASVTLLMRTGEVVIKDGLGLPEATLAFWEAVRRSLVTGYKILPLDEYNQLLAKANKGE